MQQTGTKGMQQQGWLSRKGDQQGIVQQIILYSREKQQRWHIKNIICFFSFPFITQLPPFYGGRGLTTLQCEQQWDI